MFSGAGVLMGQPHIDGYAQIDFGEDDPEEETKETERASCVQIESSDLAHLDPTHVSIHR